MNLIALPAFTDNYIWLLHDGIDAVVIDPGDCAPVLAALDRLRLRLEAILVTHHHDDHVGGVTGLRSRLQGCVYGPAFETMPEPCTRLRGGETVRVLGLDFDVIDVPGHTSGHIAYFHQPKSQPEPPIEAPLLFCGDTLFSGGCGRLFEGTPAQMHHSLSALAALPGDTHVCCAHEYTLANLRFARAVEPGNAALAEREARERASPTMVISTDTPGGANISALPACPPSPAAWPMSVPSIPSCDAMCLR